MSSHAKSSPPPPYAVTSAPQDPLDSTGLKREFFQGSSASIAWNSITDHSEGWNGRSSEDLSDLLFQADELIKDRENGSVFDALS